ncbi:MAG: hypothetical protein U9Q76_04085 [candidate division WOR-3 bacterium]|nr:hypothetical protein [candidate division WOR-3 bacterium]
MSSEATLRILRMVSESKITAEEAEKLLEAIEGACPQAREITILVFEKEKEKPNVRINLPLSLARFAMNFVPASVLAKQEIPADTILKALDEAQPGKVFEVKDEEGKKVEIYLH